MGSIYTAFRFFSVFCSYCFSPRIVRAGPVAYMLGAVSITSSQRESLMVKTLFQTPKGIRDVLPDEQSAWFRVEEAIRSIVRIYGYGRLDLPVFEETALYERGVGEGTDIVEKEMYTFQDRGGNSVTLRPEFTAGVVRAYLEHGMSNLTKPVRVWNMGPVFRYERPQAGRFRQHVQFNVEALGAQDPAVDVEVMSVAWQLYDSLKFKHRTIFMSTRFIKFTRSKGCREDVHHWRPSTD